MNNLIKQASLFLYEKLLAKCRPIEKRFRRHFLEYMRNKRVIKIIVEDNWFTLSGQTLGYFEKRSAKLRVNNSYGVKSVINKIQIIPNVTLNEVKNKIIKEFKRNAVVDAERIEIKVNGSGVR